MANEKPVSRICHDKLNSA